jgi:hypothetical protein
VSFGAGQYSGSRRRLCGAATAGERAGPPPDALTNSRHDQVGPQGRRGRADGPGVGAVRVERRSGDCRRQERRGPGDRFDGPALARPAPRA